jgi:DNA mismatch repair protein MutL
VETQAENRRGVRRLDPRVVAKIAAGEVILRPSSVVKELLENALDAGAANIEVSLGDGPDQWLQVADDGCGMSLDDLLAAVEPHATSKLASEDDLLRVSTFGFRGEALPSIARVARLAILTYDGVEGQGHRLLVEGGEQSRLEPAARSRGTTVRVEDLFFNSPVRKRFLKSPESEVRLIVRLTATCALAFPAVGFRLQHRGMPLLELAPADGLPARIAQVYGPSFAGKILPVEAGTKGGEIQGYIGIPELARPSTQHQTLLVNQRWVSVNWFSAALRQGYGDLIAPQRHPFALISLVLDPGRVDVNVHPTKREVRFLDEQVLFGDLMRAVKDQTQRLVPGWNLDPKDRGTGRLWESSGLGDRRPGGEAGEGLRLPRQEILQMLYSAPPRPAEAEPAEPGSAPPLVRETAGGPDCSEAAPAAGDEGAGAGDEARPGGLIQLWQLHRRYIFAQTRQGLLIIDQHAAHERVIYEQALETLRGRPAVTQQFLFPLVVQLDREEEAAWSEFAAEMPRLGVDAEEFGNQALLLRGAPVLWTQDPEGRLRELLSELGSRRMRGEGREERLAASFACRSAIRTGQELTLEEMNSLVDQLFASRVPHGDPHGRPTFLQVSLEDLDRRFGRLG